MPAETRIYGLDGCPGGWVVASASPDLSDVAWAAVADAELGAFCRPLIETAGPIAIDVPIGLADRDSRACDTAARLRLGAPRQNSVFSAPCRATLAAETYAQACAINRELRQRAISRQTWGIINKIATVDALLDELPALAARVWECHPEVTFAELAAQSRGIGASKKSAAGQRRRLELLETAGLPLDLETVRHRVRGLRIRRDDIVDAAACLVTAARIASGQAIWMPPGPSPRDARGRKMQITA